MFKRRTYKKLSDPILVEMIQSKHDTHALGILYERYAHLVYGLSLNYLKNKNDAQDVTSTIFEQLIQKIERSDIQHFKSWLYTVSKNECLMFLRKQKPMNEFEMNQSDQGAEDSDAFLLKESQLIQLEKEIEALKSDQKQCIQLFYFEHKSYEQISQLTQLPLSKVKSAIQNGKRNLKISLEHYHEFKK